MIKLFFQYLIENDVFYVLLPNRNVEIYLAFSSDSRQSFCRKFFVLKG